MVFGQSLTTVETKLYIYKKNSHRSLHYFMVIFFNAFKSLKKVFYRLRNRGHITLFICIKKNYHKIM